LGSLRIVLSPVLQDTKRKTHKIISEYLEKIKNSVKEDAFAEKKVLVTGDAGFIGSLLCDVVVGLGADLIELNDLSQEEEKTLTI